MLSIQGCPVSGRPWRFLTGVLLCPISTITKNKSRSALLTNVESIPRPVNYVIKRQQTVTPLMNTQLTGLGIDRKSTRLNSSHVSISYAVFCSKKKIFSRRILETYEVRQF